MQNEEGQITEKLTDLNISKEGSAPKRLIEKEKYRSIQLTLGIVEDNGIHNIHSQYLQVDTLAWMRKKSEARMRRQQQQ